MSSLQKKDRDGLSRRKDSPFYWASFTDASGKRVRRSTGTKDLKEAKAILAKWKLEAHQVQTWGVEPERTFEQLMVRYLNETKSKRSHSTDLQITKRLRHFFAGQSMNDLGAKRINGYIRFRKASGVSDSTIRRELGLMSSVINYAQTHWEWSIPNPVTGRRPKSSPGRVRWITMQEADRLIAAVDGDYRRQHLRDFILLGLNTGMRSQEMLGLVWPRVDLKSRLVYLGAGDNKSGREHSVPLNDEAYSVLLRRANFRARYCPDSKWVFARQDGTQIKSVKKGFRAACADAGIENFTPHDLRHTCAAWLVQAGVSLAQIKELLNHTSVQVTEKYAHLAPENIREAVSVLNRDRHDLVTLKKEKSATH